MKVYKRSTIIMIRESSYAVFGGLVAFFITSLFTENYLICATVAVVLLLVMLYWALISSLIQFEIDNNEFRYFKKGKLVQSYNLENCTIRYSIRTKGMDSDIYFYILDYSKGDEEFQINASALGANRFNKMYSDLEKIVAKEETLEVLKG